MYDFMLSLFGLATSPDKQTIAMGGWVDLFWTQKWNTYIFLSLSVFIGWVVGMGGLVG
jgi:hypothetical protein